MRLLILNWRDLAHPRAGGSEVYAQELAKIWAAGGHEVTYFAAAVPGRPPEEQVEGYRLVRRGSRFSVYKEARRFFERSPGQFDVVLDVVNTRPFFPSRWPGDVPVVALIYQTAEEVWRHEVPWPAALLGRHLLEPRWLRRYADGIVLTISESSRQALAGFGIRHIAVLPVGVRTEIAPSEPAEPSPTLLWVGRLSRNKRPDHAIEAFQLARSQMPDARLWIVGDGPMRDALRRQAPIGVTFHGHVDQHEKWRLMARADGLLATSVREGWGMTVTEAAQQGTRALAYDVPGLRDSVPPAGGQLVSPNPEALAEAIGTTLPAWRREGRAHLGRAGGATWDEVAEAAMIHLRGAQRARSVDDH